MPTEYATTIILLTTVATSAIIFTECLYSFKFQINPSNDNKIIVTMDVVRNTRITPHTIPSEILKFI
jgi:hypothetical protein